MKSRIFTFIVMSVLSISGLAQTMDKECSVLLDYISKGYVVYGVEKIKNASNANSLAAQFYMGQCLEYGIGVEKSIVKAFKYYRKTAERGLPDAMYRMAMFYDSGIVVTRNESRKQEYLNLFGQKGGKSLLPNILTAYNEGLTHPEHYTENPLDDCYDITGNINTQNTGNVNSNNHHVITNITIVQQANSQLPMDSSLASNEQLSERSVLPQKSDVDTDIPITSVLSPNTFALIIANEDYQNVAKVPNALNDGRVFAEYCKKTLGLPKTNVHLVENATFNNIKRNLTLIKKIAEAYKGNALFIVYYSGHGLPDEASKNAYLMPVDGDYSDLTTCYSLADFYKVLGELSSPKVIVLLDACFSGSQRGSGMLVSARGISIKAKSNVLRGNMLVLSAAQGDETAYPYEEKNHGMFTYFLLKKIKETQGKINLGDMFLYIKDNVVKRSLVVNAKQQTPSCNVSSLIADNWKTWTLR